MSEYHIRDSQHQTMARLKLEVIQRHWKWHHLIDHIWVPIGIPQ